MAQCASRLHRQNGKAEGCYWPRRYVYACACARMCVSSPSSLLIANHHHHLALPAGSDVSILVRCKDQREHRLAIKSKRGSEYEIDRALAVLSAYAFPNKLKFLFAFSHTLADADGNAVEPLQPYDPVKEFSRQGILDVNNAGVAPGDVTDIMHRDFARSFPWRLSHANVAFTLCGTYPQVLAMPAAQSDDDLFLVSKFRTCICVYVHSCVHPSRTC